MAPILEQVDKERKVIEQTQTDLNELIRQKDRTEERIRRVERNHMDDRLSIAMGNIRDINESLSDIQNSLNSVWKKTQKVQQEIKELLAMPFSLSRPVDYPQPENQDL